MASLVEIFEDRRNWLVKILQKLNFQIKREYTKRGKHITTNSRGNWEAKHDSDYESSDDPDPIDDVKRSYVLESESPMMRAATLEKKSK
jgi:hypothetical protein